MQAGLLAMGIDATPEQGASLLRHLELVYETNQALNLTAIPRGDAVPMHVLDSLSSLPFVASAPDGRLADLGSGAGFPGIPLAIMTGREVALVESVRKKATFLERVSEDLCLKATVHAVRAEELAQQQSGAFSVVTARALSALPSIVELAAPLLGAGGLLVCLKGEPTDEELSRGDRVALKCGMKRTAAQSVSVPGVSGARTLVVYAKTGTPSVKLPRRNGMAQRQPLA